MMRPAEKTSELQGRTIADFGQQWLRYGDNSGFYGSLDLFRDVFGPLLSPEDVQGLRVADIGSGTGRIVQMLIAAGAAHVTAVEPSDAFAVLEATSRQYGERVRCLRLPGDQLPEEGYDLVVSIGVIHHIPRPLPVLEAARRALRPGGKLAIWIYGREGNETYLALVRPLRAVTTRLPHAILTALSWLFTVAISVYAAVCRLLPLPLHAYMRNVVRHLSWGKRHLTIYDQLNPAHAHYYSREEAIGLLESAGFVGIRVHHRHGYSWSVIGQRPPGRKGP